MINDINESFSLVEQQTAYIAGLKEKMDQIKGITNDYQDENTESTFKNLSLIRKNANWRKLHRRN